MYLFFFLTALLLSSITLHVNRIPLSALMLFIVVALSAIPVLNILVSILCIAELAFIACRNHVAAKRGYF